MFNTINHFKFIIISFTLAVFTGTINGQDALRPRSVLSAGGTTGFITVNGMHYYLQHTIGQQSITGLSGNQNYMLRQGFIQPIDGLSNKSAREVLPAYIYPNPFYSHLNISFFDETAGPYYITLYSSDGKIAFLRKYESVNNIDIDLSSLPPSVYILKLTTSKKSFYSRIIKF